MHRYNHLGLNRPLKGESNIVNDIAGGPPLPDSENTLQQLRQQCLLNDLTHHPSTANNGLVNGALGQAAVNGNPGAPLHTETKEDEREISAHGLTDGHPGQGVVNCNLLLPYSTQENSQMVQKSEKPKGYDSKDKSGYPASVYAVPQGMTGEARMGSRAEPVLNDNHGKISDPRSSRQHPGQMNMQSDKPNFGQPGSTIYKQGYKPTRASGLSAGLQTPQITGSEGETIRVSNCAAPIDQKQKISSSNTRSQQGGPYHEDKSTKDQAGSNELCCICGEPYSKEDPKVFTKCCKIAIGSDCKAQHIAESGKCWNCGEKDVQNEAKNLSGTDSGHQLKGFLSKSFEFLSKRFSDTSKSAKQTYASDSNPAQSSQPLFVNRTKEGCNREAEMYQLQSAEVRSAILRAAHSSSLLIDGDMEKGSVNEGLNAKATPQERYNFLYDGSESASSGFSEDDQQHLCDLTPKEQEQNEAKQYLIEATEHLIELCNVYGDKIADADKDEVMNKVLTAIEGCPMFQAVIEKRLGGSSALAAQPASVQNPATIDSPDLQSVVSAKNWERG